MTRYIDHVHELFNDHPVFEGVEVENTGWTLSPDRQALYSFSPAPGIVFEVGNLVDRDACPDGGDIEDFIYGYEWNYSIDGRPNKATRGNAEEFIAAIAEAKENRIV